MAAIARGYFATVVIAAAVMVGSGGTFVAGAASRRIIAAATMCGAGVRERQHRKHQQTTEDSIACPSNRRAVDHGKIIGRTLSQVKLGESPFVLPLSAVSRATQVVTTSWHCVPRKRVSKDPFDQWRIDRRIGYDLGYENRVKACPLAGQPEATSIRAKAANSSALRSDTTQYAMRP